ncbi:MAG TPA: hypothetical protein PKN59_00425 [Syntrophales bacterium]|nr:hypothetical protein [Syntrophales bacterium]
MAVFQLIFREPWPLGQELRPPGEIVLEGECRIPGATPDKIEKAIRFNAIQIREVPAPSYSDTAADAPAAARRRKPK